MFDVTLWKNKRLHFAELARNGRFERKKHRKSNVICRQRNLFAQTLFNVLRCYRFDARDR